MILFYNIGILLTGLGIRIASLWNPKAKKWIAGRKNWKKQWRESHKNSSKRVLFQCASLGEYEQAVPIMEALKSNGFQISISFFSPSGYEYLSKKNHGWEAVNYFPLDTKKNANTILKFGDFQAIFFVKYELWYHILNQAKHKNIPCYLISATFRENHRYFKWYGGFFRKMLTKLDQIFVQNKESQDLLLTIQINSLLSGDTRFDRVLESHKWIKELPEIKKWKGGKKLLILGSSWKEEELILSQSLSNLEEYQILIAPHNIELNHLKQIKELFPGAVFYSENTSLNTNETVLILDTIGHLSSVYQYGDFALIGGAFRSSGLHNILEALAFDCKVLFGPNHQNFWEAQAAIDFGCATQITDNTDLYKALKSLEKEKSSGKEFIRQNAGAGQVILSRVTFKPE
jgi:3-deoxy-D-manno-octulosonic-acid transferase